MNQFRIYFKSSNVNGRPQVRVWVGDRLVEDQQLVNEIDTIEFSVANETTIHVERYGKTKDNSTDELDQYLEIEKITVDNIRLPDFILYNHSHFKFDNQSIVGLTFNPNGVWTFKFEQPFITWVLDQKILHESQWDQSYQYSWASKLGPDSVSTIGQAIQQAQEKVNLIL